MSSSLPSSVIFLTAFPLHLMSLLVPCVPGSLTSTPPVTFSSLPSLSVSWSQPESCHDQKLCYLWHFYCVYLTFVPSAHHFLSYHSTCSDALTATSLLFLHNFLAVLSLGSLEKMPMPRPPFPKNSGGELGTSGITFLKLLMWLLCIVRVEIHDLILWL